MLPLARSLSLASLIVAGPVAALELPLPPPGEDIVGQIQVVKAKAEADAQRQRFTAEADGIRMRGEAEAASIRAKAEALAANTNLVSLNAVEKWDGVLPSTQVPGAALPFIGIK